MDATAIVFVLWAITFVIGFVKLLSNWEGFGDRAWPMLFVTTFFPFGFLWPLLATPHQVIVIKQ
jgi:hypothetical protein